MPKRSRRPCSHSGCPELTDSRYCERHKRESDANYNRYQRDPDTSKRYGRAWKRIRDRYIQAHPLCEMCTRDGKLTPAEQVHHVVALSRGGTNDVTNLMSLCSSCHSTITAREGGRWG